MSNCVWGTVVTLKPLQNKPCGSYTSWGKWSAGLVAPTPSCYKAAAVGPHDLLWPKTPQWDRRKLAANFFASWMWGKKCLQSDSPADARGCFILSTPIQCPLPQPWSPGRPWNTSGHGIFQDSYCSGDCIQGALLWQRVTYETGDAVKSNPLSGLFVVFGFFFQRKRLYY